MTTILLVEDNPGDARLIAEHLRETSNLVEEYEVIHVERVSDAVAMLENRDDIDLILSDITLPDSRGTDTLSALNDAAHQVPIIFMTGTNDEGLAMTAINQGAQDYLTKGRIDSEVLSRAIRYAIERQRFQNDINRVMANDQMNQQRIRMLAEQRQKLIKLNHSKDEFISIASHQLRTPATAVKQYVGLIVQGLAGDVSEQQRELLDRAYASNERQLNVINELLKTARLDSSKVQLSLQPCSVNQIIEACIADVDVAMQMRNQTLHTDMSQDYEVMADYDELKLVVLNVLENASKYTPPGRQINVSTLQHDAKVEIRITDQGVGIKPEDQAVIFEKFSRVDNDLSDTVQGSGLGLYWAKRIMKLHKGTIHVESTLGEGSTFVLCLPL